MKIFLLCCALLGICFLFKGGICNLTDKGLGKLLPEFDIIRHCVLCDILPAMLKYRFFQFIRIGIALFQDDIGFDLLNLVRILNADNAAHLYSLMSINDIFKLGGIDIVAAGHDHPLDALFEIDEAVGIHIAEISGMEPSVAVGMYAESIRILLGSVEVTYHNGRAPQADLAEFSERNGVISPNSANGIIGIRIRKTDAASRSVVYGVRQLAVTHSVVP